MMGMIWLVVVKEGLVIVFVLGDDKFVSWNIFVLNGELLGGICCCWVV